MLIPTAYVSEADGDSALATHAAAESGVGGKASSTSPSAPRASESGREKDELPTAGLVDVEQPLCRAIQARCDYVANRPIRDSSL